MNQKTLPVLIVLLALASFLAGAFFTKIQYLEGGKVGQAKPTPTPSQALPLSPTVLGQEEVAKLIDGAPMRGNKDAQVTIIEFSDFQCPACGGAAPSVKKILADYEGKIKLYFRQFPLETIHPLARTAALASFCAQEQGKFWEYHDKIFENQKDLSETSLKKWAGDLKLNQVKFNTCFNNKQYDQAVDNDISLGNSVNISGTPTFYVNGKIVEWNAQTEGWYNALKRYIEAELK